MKSITEDKKGITLVALIITIILMLILASVTTYTGINTYKNTRVNRFVAQMQLIQTKIDDLVDTKTTEELNNMQLKSVTTQEQRNSINSAFSNGEVTTNDINSYKVFTKDDVLNILDVEDIQNDIIVNLKTREIVDLNGIEYEGTTYYTQYKLPTGQTIINGTSIERDLSFTIDPSIDGINSIVTAKDIKITNGILSYKEENDDYWQNITNYTESSKAYDISISKSGNYTFKLQDNTSNQNYTERTISIILANKPKTTLKLQPYDYGLDSDKWAYAQKDNVNYVWIPRFVYNNGNIKYIKGNSNIATDDTYINDEWILHNKFTSNNGTKLTGVWVRVDSTNKSGLNMIELLNSDATILTEI